jgi:hypothetical protein
MGWRFFAGSVGGVGKTMSALAYFEHLLAQDREFAVVESDVNSNVADYVEGRIPKDRLHLIDLLVPDGWVELLDLVGSEKLSDVLVSLPAGAPLDVEEHGGLLAVAIADLKIPTSIFWAMNPSPQSVLALERTMKTFAKSPVKFIAARNLFFGPADSFAEYNGSKVQKALLKAGGVEADIPELNRRAVAATILKNPMVPFSANGESLHYGVRMTSHRWLAHMGAMYNEIDAKLGEKALVPVNA